MGEVTVVQTLFLNVFLAVEFFKVLVRAVFAARDDSLRLITDDHPHSPFLEWFHNFAGQPGGYGTLLVVPVISNQLSAELGALTNLLIVLVALSLCADRVRRQRDHVREGLSSCHNKRISP